MAEDTALDREFLEELLDGDVEFAQVLFETYFQSADAAYVEAEERLAADDSGNAFRPFHTLKGASASVGLVGVQELAKSMELRAKAGELDYCREQMPNLKAVLESAKSVLSEYLESLS